MRVPGRSRFLRLLVLTLTLTALSGVSAPAPVAGATTVKVCGEVTTYVEATALLAGSLVIGGVPFVIKAGTVLDSDVRTGANLCLELTLDASGSVTDAVVRANASASVAICGDVTAYAKATTTTTGSLKIAGRTFVLAAGSSLPAAVKVGADLCLELTLNGFGQVQDGTATANATTRVRICGEVTAYAAASLTSTGTLKIAGRSFVLALGSSLPASVKAGADLCLDLTLNGFGQVSSGGATANVETRVRLCGVVSSYAAASLTKTGQLVIDGHSFVLALGADLPAAVKAGADLCLDLSVNVYGQVSGGTAIVNVHATLDVCGRVETYVAASATNNGRLVIGSVDRPIAAGTSFASSVKAGAYLKLRLTVDAFGRISKGSVLKVGVSVADACGTAAPTPTPDGNAPTPTPTPGGATPTPTLPGATPTPDGGATPTPDGGATPTPDGGATPTPNVGATPTPDVGATPTAGATAGATGTPDACVPGNGSTGHGSPGDGSTGNGTGQEVGLPDTASLGRTSTLVAATAVPLLLGLGALLGTLVQRRRAMVPVESEDETAPDDPDAR